MALDLEGWFASGERIQVASNPGGHPTLPDSRHIFCKIRGTGPWQTLLHGFPTCSWDWTKIGDDLSRDHRLLMFDFLGFGDSDKPVKHRYSIFEQADITEALWQHFGIEETGLLAHDYGDSVALELLSRQKERNLSTKITNAVLLNGGIYVDYQQPLAIQKLLLRPVLGELLSRLLSERTFKKRFASIFSKTYPVSAPELAQHWQGIIRHRGKRNYHRLIQYLHERRQFKSRWEDTLENSEVPIRFIWGLADPVSGRSISDQILARNPGADLIALSDVGHYPQLEVPDKVTAAILAQN